MSRELKQNSKGGHFGYEVNNLLNEKEIYLSKQDIFNIAKYAIEKHIVIVTLSKEWEDIQNSYTDMELQSTDSNVNIDMPKDYDKDAS